MRAHPNSRQTLRGLTDSRARAGARIGAFFRALRLLCAIMMRPASRIGCCW
jgi:hypothetical protein